MLLFVYGTLLSGLDYAWMLEDADFLGLGIIEGVMFNVSWFPAVVAGDGYVIGELYRINDYHVRALDDFEGYHEHQEEESLFIRREVEVRLFADGYHVRAFCYLYNSDTGAERIPCGDYRRYLIEKNSSCIPLAVPDGEALLTDIKERFRGSFLLNALKPLDGRCYSYSRAGVSDDVDVFVVGLNEVAIVEKETKSSCLRIGLPFVDSNFNERLVECYLDASYVFS